MKILKMRNGIALIAVMTILVITSLFIPVMFDMSDTSLRVALIGTDRQRSSYLARTITEMSVGAFKAFDSRERSEIIDANELAQYDKIKAEYEKLLAKEIQHIYTDEIAMFVTKKEGTKYYKIVTRAGLEFESVISEVEYDTLNRQLESAENPETLGYRLRKEESTPENPIYVEEIVYANVGSQEFNTYSGDPGYKEIGRGSCEITYDDSVHYYRTEIATQEITEISKSQYDSALTTLEETLAGGGTVSYSLSKQENRNVIFKSTATVNKLTTSRSCILVLQTYPGEEDWFVFGIETGGSQIPTGGNQVFVDPKKATSRIPIEYNQGITEGYIKQTLLVYSSVGNMLIKPVAFKDPSGTPHSSGNGNSEFVLGIQPGLNTTPNNDPSYAIIDGVNYDSSTEVAQMNNFVAFASTSGIQVDMPINLLVNPCRAKRFGDGYILGAGDPNGSLFKIMIFQSPIVQFNERLDMMMSFYVRDNEKARRMSSIVLSAPENTPYSYYNADRNKTVKAGKVYFTEDCYLWVIPYGEDGSSSNWSGTFSETVYERDSDFTKIKIANAGDVYYFNSEVMVDDERVGVSLTGWALETNYIPNMESYESGEWWQIWSNTKTAIFANYMQGEFGERDQTYRKEDLKFIGNINDGDLIEYPEIDDYYTIWTN